MVIDLNTKEYTQKFLHSPIYKKFAEITAIQVTENTKVDTIVNGKNETTNNAEPGDYIVRNPDGEEYVVKKEKFDSKYEFTGQTIMINKIEKKVYTPKGKIRAFKNDTNEEVELTAPWGEQMYGDESCYFVAVCDDSGDIGEDRYLIENRAFNNTYKMI